MTRQNFDSKLVSSAGFDGDAGEIEIEFRNKPGTLYRYQDCTRSTWNAFSKFPSQGRYFHRFLKGKKFSKIEPK